MKPTGLVLVRARGIKKLDLMDFQALPGYVAWSGNPQNTGNWIKSLFY